MENARGGGLLLSLSTVLLVVACGGAADAVVDVPNGPRVVPTSAYSFAGQFGDVITVKLVAHDGSGAPPPLGTKVSFAPSDGGLVDWPTYALPPDGSAQVRWRLGPIAKVQTLTARVDGGQPFAFQATVTGNAWVVTTAGTMRFVTRFADEGSSSLTIGPPWANTPLGSPPRLVISCDAGNIGVAVTHPGMVAESSQIAYGFPNVVTDTDIAANWAQLAPRSDSLFHPGPATAAGALVKQMAAAAVFRFSFRQYTEGRTYSPTFGTAGLGLVLSQLMANCPAAR